MGERQAFCPAHLPQHVERLPSGAWADFSELQRLRTSLDRARTLLDVLVRRERYKRMLHKADTEVLGVRFGRAVDKAKHRKTLDEDVALSDLSLLGSETEEEESEGEGDVGGAGGVGGAGVGVGAGVGGAGVGLELLCSTGDLVTISPRWVKRRGLRLPKRLTVSFAGVSLDRRDFLREGRSFPKYSRAAVQTHYKALRPPQGGVFSSLKADEEFGRRLGADIAVHVGMSGAQFGAAVGGCWWMRLAKKV
ncbi:hypothetical protein B484DRAFT_414515, partial [Ochromonadaceae sp. CCMP2298]